MTDRFSSRARWSVAICVLWMAGGPGVATAQYERAEAAFGRQLYRAHCAACHGTDGSQVAGVAFGSGRFARAATDRDLARLIGAGIPGTAMPPGSYTATELGGLVAYLRSFNSAESDASAIGDAARGRIVFEVKGGCMSCHRVEHQGSRAASDLSDVGVLRTAAALKRALVDPNAALLPMNRSVRAVTRSGSVITGRRLNEDTHTVQIADEQGRLLSVDKNELRRYEIEPSAMPSYRETLTAAERADVLAYLLSLKGVTP